MMMQCTNMKDQQKGNFDYKDAWKWIKKLAEEILMLKNQNKILKDENFNLKRLAHKLNEAI